MISELESIRAWFTYLEDTRRDYAETLATLPSAELTRDRGASYRSLLDIFAHSQGALHFWVKDIARFEFSAQEVDPEVQPSMDVLRKDEAYVQAQIRRSVREPTEVDLTRTIPRKKGKGSSHDCQVPVREAPWHLAEEELEHPGELSALLWQINVEAPIRSGIDWAWARDPVDLGRWYREHLGTDLTLSICEDQPRVQRVGPTISTKCRADTAFTSDAFTAGWSAFASPASTPWSHDSELPRFWWSRTPKRIPTVE